MKVDLRWEEAQAVIDWAERAMSAAAVEIDPATLAEMSQLTSAVLDRWEDDHGLALTEDPAVLFGFLAGLAFALERCNPDIPAEVLVTAMHLSTANLVRAVAPSVPQVTP